MKYTITSQVLYTYTQEIEADSYEDALNIKDNLDFDVNKSPWEIAYLNVNVEPMVSRTISSTVTESEAVK
jgi:dsDNA-binding SOS-regulon protein